MTYDLNLNNPDVEDQLRVILNEEMENLLNVSPIDSNATSKIRKTEHGYHGVLKIVSTQGKFMAEAAAQNLDELVRSMFLGMYRQMRTWRNCRFIAS